MNKRININTLLRFTQLSTIVFFLSCNGHYKTTAPQETSIESPAASADTVETTTYVDPFKDLNMDAQIMQVMRRVFQDSKGILWFVGDGVFCYDGDSLFDLTHHEVFDRTVVRQIAEDQQGNIWFGTHSGIVKFERSPTLPPDSGIFTSFNVEHGLIDNDVWSMAIDHKGVIWIGTIEGLCRYDGDTFIPITIPESEPDDSRGVTSAKVVHSIMQDSKGQMWFATNGGAYIYDPATERLSNISDKDGLCHNTVNDILEDKNGNIWFATHHQGVCRWNGSTFTHFTEKDGITGTEAWSLYEDPSGNIWFPIENSGLYRYDGKTFTNFHKEEGLLLNAVHSIVEDKEERIWAGGFGGLYRYASDSFVNVTYEGPWPE